MKRFSSFITIVVTAAVGIIFIVWNSHIALLSWFVIAMGICLILPGLVSLIETLTTRYRGRRTVESSGQEEVDFVEKRTPSFFTIVASICTVALGVWMILAPDFFIGIIAYLFAAILIVYGLYQIYSLGWLNAGFAMPWFLYVVPVLMVGAGVVIMCTSVHTMNSVVVLLAGIMLVVSAVNKAMGSMARYQFKRRSRNDG